MIGTYAAALLVIGASVPVGAAVLTLAGRREWSWIGPALGLAVITALAWGLIRLPGEGLTALIGILVLALACAALALPRLVGLSEAVREGLPVALLALAAVSIPFLAEGHFGILGTGFNVDMSQHLFTAEWISTQLGPAPPLLDQGYPVGPHALAVAGSEIPGSELATAFSGITIAVPVVGAMTALAGTRRLGRLRGTVAAVLVAIPFLVASYLAQGAFKELFEAVFVLAFALWLHELRKAEDNQVGAALPGAALIVGALYAYSGPGLVWLIGTVGIWAAFELLLDRRRALSGARRAAPAVLVGLVVCVVATAPEIGRIVEFGGSAGNVANARDSEPRASLSLNAQNATSDADPGGGQGDEPRLDLFDNDLGNLFGDVPALEVLGVWPSGDFRVQPGDGAIPAVVFYAGALLGLAALAVGLAALIKRRESALGAGLLAALLIWLAAWLLSTPYTAAKALQMVAPLLMLVSLRGVLDRDFSQPPWLVRGPRALSATLLAAAFVVAAAGSSVLALANAPVGPERYTAGIGKLRERLTNEPLLMLAPPGQLAERHGDDFYGWELRGGRPICIEPFPEDGDGFDRESPAGVRFVITLGGKQQAPFNDVVEVSRRRRVALWEVEAYDAATAPPIKIDESRPTECELGLAG